ncbi:hypothetical protein F442_04194 [Phytophthora nicotianae P10297]|uniref:Uncharacterized protein n=2 Tax=Phytophthora nicotianae TaxID=4792 RepID=V9FMK8_PHYNI|nr:hypothetical protein F443_04226 [Phytophthora nicotianae P1569]ETP50521.1 hypothetical protein F442_04194 [Phytophthora nicotianae P10297]
MMKRVRGECTLIKHDVPELLSYFVVDPAVK